MSDEKWCFGLVSRTFAKMCPALGIDKEVFAVHHKKTHLKSDGPRNSRLLLHRKPAPKTEGMAFYCNYIGVRRSRLRKKLIAVKVVVS
jgi:hypothetical protein